MFSIDVFFYCGSRDHHKKRTHGPAYRNCGRKFISQCRNAHANACVNHNWSLLSSNHISMQACRASVRVDGRHVYAVCGSGMTASQQTTGGTIIAFVAFSSTQGHQIRSCHHCWRCCWNLSHSRKASRTFCAPAWKDWEEGSKLEIRRVADFLL